MKKPLVVAGILVLLAAWLIWHQVSSRVLIEKASPSGDGRVIVREIQLHPISLTALIRANEMVYRCEYYPHPGWPMFAAQSFGEDSYIARTVKIEWHDESVVEVVIDNSIGFKCVKGQWQRVPFTTPGK